ncbi:MAG TPA: class I SAM-dependent methyltransferase [Gaiellaceae bacterium]
MSAADEIRETYEARDAATRFDDWRASRYHPRNPMGRLFVEHNAVLIDLLNEQDISLHDLSVLDVGCGAGNWLRHLVELGARPANLVGVDLSTERLEFARQANPGISWLEAGDGPLPFPDASFGLVMQTLVFSSIPDEQLRRRLAQEMLRVAGRYLMWLDLLPAESHLATFSGEQAHSYFPGTELVYRRRVQPGYFRHWYSHPWLCKTVARFTDWRCESALMLFEKQR